MSTAVTELHAEGAACGKSGNDLKVFHEALFKHPEKEDCPICFLPLPILVKETQYQTCCGKVICKGCAFATVLAGSLITLCPFCRTPVSTTGGEAVKRLKQRSEIGDPSAFLHLGGGYVHGTHGLPLDCQRGFELVLKAAELGLTEAHCNIAGYYRRGLGVDVDVEKAKHHLEIAVMGGNVVAMYNLGVSAYEAGNYDRAKKHWLVAASAGLDLALVEIRKLFCAGHATKDEFERALRAHKDSVDEMKSDQRDTARANHHLFG